MLHSFSTEAVFERVKSGGGQLHAKSADGPRLTLDNKFSALRGDHCPNNNNNNNYVNYFTKNIVGFAQKLPTPCKKNIENV